MASTYQSDSSKLGKYSDKIRENYHLYRDQLPVLAELCSEMSREILTATECNRTAMVKISKLETEIVTLKEQNRKMSADLSTVLELLKTKAGDVSSSSDSLSAFAVRPSRKEPPTHSTAKKLSRTSIQSTRTKMDSILSTAAPIHTSPRRFNGEEKETFDEYMQHFRVVASLNSWDDEKAALHLQVSLGGRALKLALELPEHERQDYDTLVDHLQNRLGKILHQSDYVRKFYSREKTQSESPADFVNALQKLARDAFPDRNDEDITKMIKQQLVHGYKDSSVAVALAIDNGDCSLKNLIRRAEQVSELLQPKCARLVKAQGSLLLTVVGDSIEMLLGIVYFWY